MSAGVGKAARKGRCRRPVSLIGVVLLFATTARAQAPYGFWSQPTLLGDLGGARTALADRGVTFGLSEADEAFGNLTGGTHRGADYDGLTTLNIGLDTEKAFGLAGGIFNVSLLQIHGRNLSTDNLQTLQIASENEALPSTRLWELWYQQSMLDGHVDVKIGQQSIDQEFLISTGSTLFINSVMGWPMPPAIDLYAGGPDYPLSALGLRVRVNSIGPFSILAAVFDDNPPGGSFNNDSQLRGAEQTGTLFNLGTGAIFIAEVQYALDQPSGLAGTYKIGAWFDTASFLDQRFDTSGVSLASPLSNGNPRMHRFNYSVYGVVDQAVWRPDASSPRVVGVFARIMDGPGDRNLIPFAVNAGLTLKAPLPGRDYDIAGLGWGFVGVSGSAAGFNRDATAFGGYSPVRSSESFVELTYQCQIAGWWQVQPDAQYVFMPGAGVANPLQPGKRVGNELVLGVRSTFTF